MLRRRKPSIIRSARSLLFRKTVKLDIKFVNDQFILATYDMSTFPTLSRQRRDSPPVNPSQDNTDKSSEKQRRTRKLPSTPASNDFPAPLLSIPGLGSIISSASKSSASTYMLVIYDSCDYCLIYCYIFSFLQGLLSWITQYSLENVNSIQYWYILADSWSHNF